MKGNGGQQKRLMASLNGEAIPVRAPGASVSTLLRDALRLVAHLPWRTVRFAMNCSSHSKIGSAREEPLLATLAPPVICYANHADVTEGLNYGKL
jgi:hypothetical protein